MAKAPANIRSLARAYTESCIKRIEGLAEKAQSENVRLDANKALLDRGWGRPKETTEISGPDGEQLAFVFRHIQEGSKPPKK